MSTTTWPENRCGQCGYQTALLDCERDLPGESILLLQRVTCVHCSRVGCRMCTVVHGDGPRCFPCSARSRAPARARAIGILSLGKLRSLEDAGLVVLDRALLTAALLEIRGRVTDATSRALVDGVLGELGVEEP